MSAETFDGVDSVLLVNAVTELAEALRAGVAVWWLPGGEVLRFVAATGLGAVCEARSVLRGEYERRLAVETDGGVAEVWREEHARLIQDVATLGEIAASLRDERLPGRVPVSGLAALDVVANDSSLGVVWAFSSPWGWLLCGPVAVGTATADSAEVRPEVMCVLAALLSAGPPVAGPTEGTSPEVLLLAADP